MDLSEREDIIEACRQAIQESWVEIGRQLRAIVETHQYLETHSTFRAYCLERWGYSVRHAERLIKGSDVIDRMRPRGRIAEAHIRPITELPVEHQEIVWNRALDTAPEGGITQSHVRQTIQEMFPQPEEMSPEEMSPEDGEDSWDERLSEAFITVLRLGHLDDGLYATWESERQEKWLKKIDAMMDTLGTLKKMGITKHAPRLVNGGYQHD